MKLTIFFSFFLVLKFHEIQFFSFSLCLCMSPYMHTLCETTEFFPRKYSAESIERVIVRDDNDEVMIEQRERERGGGEEREERVCIKSQGQQTYLMLLSVCLCNVRVLHMSSSREETESSICLQPLHQVSLITLISSYLLAIYILVSNQLPYIDGFYGNSISNPCDSLIEKVELKIRDGKNEIIF